MALEMRRNTVHVYEPVIANNTLGAGGFFSLMQWYVLGQGSDVS